MSHQVVSTEYTNIFGLILVTNCVVWEKNNEIKIMNDTFLGELYILYSVHEVFVNTWSMNLNVKLFLFFYLYKGHGGCETLNKT